MPDATPAPDQGPGDGPRPDACADWDGDGICDDVDRCPGFDDGVDTDGDGRPDGCDIACPADGPLAQPALPVSHGGATILAVHFPNGRSVRPGSPVELEVEFQIDRCGCNVEEGERPCQRYLMIGLDRPDAPLRCVFGGPACAPVRMAVPTSIPAPDRPGSYELRFGVDGARCRDRWQGMPPPGAFAVICVEPR